jgi:hypothetical protein
MKTRLNFLFLCALLLPVLAGACARLAGGEPEPPGEVRVENYVSAEGDDYQIQTWLDSYTPSAGDRFYVYSSMTKNGVYLGGMMYAYWPDEDEDWQYDCRTSVSYQIGVCTLFADDFPVGRYVPIQVVVEYEGVRYAAETGFTRQK